MSMALISQIKRTFYLQTRVRVSLPSTHTRSPTPFPSHICPMGVLAMAPPGSQCQLCTSVFSQLCHHGSVLTLSVMVVFIPQISANASYQGFPSIWSVSCSTSTSSSLCPAVGVAPLTRHPSLKPSAYFHFS